MLQFSALSPYKSNPLSFKGSTSVSYVVVDGHSNSDPKLIEEVTGELVKKLKNGSASDNEIRRAVREATGDSSLSQAYQAVKRIGKRIITGEDAVKLTKIWSSAGTKTVKAKQASELLKKVFGSSNMKKIAVVVDKIDLKGKVKYLIKNVYTTIY